MHPQLRIESKIYRMMEGVGLPMITCFGAEGEYNAMVMKLLHPSLGWVGGWVGVCLISANANLASNYFCFFADQLKAE